MPVPGMVGEQGRPGAMPDVPQTANHTYFKALDGLRAVALGFVFLDHYAHIPLFGLGVSVFFVLSGFLITGILWDTREQPHRARNFYIRRTLRIFPLYYAVFAVLLLSTPLMHWQWSAPWVLWPLYFGNIVLYLPHLTDAVRATAGWGVLPARHSGLFLGHFWSLCVEEQFYLLWPWVVFAASRKTLIRICWAVVIVSPLMRVLAGWYFPVAVFQYNVQFRTLLFQADALLFGALLAFAWRGGLRGALLRAGRWLPDVAALAALVYIYCCIDVHMHFLHQPFLKPFTYLTWQFTLADLLGVALVLGALQPASMMHRVLHLRPLRWVGRISYGAYVFHDMPHILYLDAANAISPRHATVLTILIAVVCTLAVAAASYRWLETPFLRLKDKWAPATR